MLIALEGSSPTIRGENNYLYYIWEIYQNTLQTTKRYIEGPAAISWGPSGVNIRTMADDLDISFHFLILVPNTTKTIN